MLETTPFVIRLPKQSEALSRIEDEKIGRSPRGLRVGGTRRTGLTMNKKELSRLCVTAATAFFQARPWQRLGDEDCLVFDLPGEPYPVAASIMGAAGETFGLPFSDLR